MHSSPSAATPASVTGAQAASVNRGMENPIPYAQKPPQWRPSLLTHVFGQRSVPDLYPTRSDQPEDDMSQLSLRKGFNSRLHVQNEIFSAHEMIHDRLSREPIRESLSRWFDEVLERRSELQRNSIAASSYKAPSRVTLNDVKLANYVKDLAEPSVPLSRLSKSVPHGFRGEKLFEMLWAGGAINSATTASAGSTAHFSPRVPPSATAPSPFANPLPIGTPSRKSVEVPRAVWFIRALGAAELTSLRNKSAAVIVPEMTTNLCSWMSKQIAELSLVQIPESSAMALVALSPATPIGPYAYPRTPISGTIQRPSIQLSRTATRPSIANSALGPSREFCSVLQSEADEERWIAKWTYSLSLARHLQAQQLLDRSALVRWVVESFAASNLVQLPFLLELVQEILPLLLQRRCFVVPFLRALVEQLAALDLGSDRQYGADLRKRLLLLLRVTCESDADALVNPALWQEHSSTLLRLLREMEAEADVTSDTYTITASYVERYLRPRAERLLLKKALDSEPSTAADNGRYVFGAHRDIAALDSFDMKLIDQVFLQSRQSETEQSRKSLLNDDSVWTFRIETILTWACTDQRSGIARQYLAATLIEKIRFGVSWDELSEGSDNLSVQLEQHAKKPRRINVEPMLIKWLGDVELALASMPTIRKAEGTLISDSPILASIDVTAVVVVVGELARRGIFAYTKYLQRLIARGMTTTLSSHSSKNPSSSPDLLHLRLLRALPLYDQPASVSLQRRQAIYGERSRETYEEAVERRALRELKSFMPFLFQERADDVSSTSHPDDESVTIVEDDKATQLDEPLEHLWSASRYVRCRIFRNELLPACFTRIEHMSGRDLSCIAAVLEKGCDFEALAQFVAALLLRNLSDALARATFNLVLAFSPIWRSMDIMSTMNQLVRQQLNHSSSIRNDRQAIMASTTLLRLRTLIEETSDRRMPVQHAGDNVNTMALQESVDAARQHVDALLEYLRERRTLPHGRLPEKLAELRTLLGKPGPQIDELIERTIIHSMLDQQNPALISPAAKIIEQLYLEASLEIDERHARWLGDLISCTERASASASTSTATTRPLFALLECLIGQGTLNLQVVVDSFVLPYALNLVRKTSDPASIECSASALLVDLVEFLSSLLNKICGADAGASWSQDFAAAAQSTLLFTRQNLPSLIRILTWLVCASESFFFAVPSQKTIVEDFWRILLQSEVMLVAFRRNPRQYLLTLKDACRQMAGCNTHQVTDLIIGYLDPDSLLLRDPNTVEADVVKQRLNGWDTSVVAMELVEIFERLQIIESNLQSRAEPRTRTLVAGIFSDIFVTYPEIGPNFLRDCESSALNARFADVGLKVLCDTTIDAASSESETWTLICALVRMSTNQKTFKFNATDSDACMRLLQHVVSELEGITVQGKDEQTQRINALFEGSTTLDLLYLLLRVQCFWSSSSKVLVGRLVKSILLITQEAGKHADLSAAFVALLDTSAFVLDEAPVSQMSVCISETEEVMRDTSLMSDERKERFLRLSFDLDSAIGDKRLFTARSAGAALKQGWYIPGGPSPWECPEYTSAPQPAPVAAQAGSLAKSVRPQLSRSNMVPPANALTPIADAKGLPAARLGWPTKLALNTALPLSLLGVRVTRDLVPDYGSPSSTGVASVGSTEAASRVGEGSGQATTAGTSAQDSDQNDEARIPLPSFLESERSYGEQTAGENIFARSIRRGTGPSTPITMTVWSKEALTLMPAVESTGTQGLTDEAPSDSNAVIDLTRDDDDTQLKTSKSKTHLREDDAVSDVPNAKKRRMFDRL